MFGFGSSNNTATVQYQDWTDIDPSEYVRRFKHHAAECIQNAYERDHSVIHRSHPETGALSSSLAEDLVSLIDTQQSVLVGFLSATKVWTTPTGYSIYMDALLYVVQCCQSVHTQSKPLFCTTNYDCCEAANDFWRLSAKMETLFQDKIQPNLPNHTTEDSVTQDIIDKEPDRSMSLYQQLASTWSSFVSLVHCDAVYCAERSQVFVMRSINNSTTFPIDLFSSSWEDVWTHNEVVHKLLAYVDEEYLSVIERYLCNETLYHKALVICCKAIVCLYVRCLVEKADSVTRRRNHRERQVSACSTGGARKSLRRDERRPFKNTHRALIRMTEDIKLIKTFFLEKSNGNPVLTRIITNDIYILEVIHECLDAEDEDSLENFIVVIHKRTGADALVTRHFVGDLWLLVAQDKACWQQVDQTLTIMAQDLAMVSNRLKEQQYSRGESGSLHKRRTEVSFVRLDDMLRTMYEDRIVQGTLPLCWTCLPKQVEADHGNKIVSGKIRALTRSLKEMRWA